MPIAVSVPAERGKKSTAKFAARRTELAQAALSTLSRLGYARSSLRDIAENSRLSHGILHYYFKDKHDLIICSIREFKTDAIARFEAALAPALDLPDLLDRLDALLETWVRRDGAANRFWLDLRGQALFDPAFRHEVLEIYAMMEAATGRFLQHLQQLTGVSARLTAETGYAIFDGLFQRCLLGHAAGRTDAIGELQSAVRGIVRSLARDNPCSLR